MNSPATSMTMYFKASISAHKHTFILISLISVSLLLSSASADNIAPPQASSTPTPTSQLAAGNVQPGSSDQIPFAGLIPSKDDKDDANGDDGPQLKKDLSELGGDSDDRNNGPVQIKNGTSVSFENQMHQFYKPEYITDPDKAMKYWVDFSELLKKNSSLSTRHDMLSKSHRRAAPIKLSFEFPFYGHRLKNIIIATGGFLYVGEHLHHWLAATQNISPLMANFDLSTSNISDIHYHDNGTALVVQWQNVQMKDNNPPGNFSFQVTLKQDGDIIFVYESLPVKVSQIPENDHPVKVGISDAFLIDRAAFFIRRKTIYDYHRLRLNDNFDITNKTAIYLKALPTCNQYDSCELCAKADAKMECSWCPNVKRCSNGFDRKRQDWLTNSCDKLDQKFDCSAKPTSSISPPSQPNSASGFESGHSLDTISPSGLSGGSKGQTLTPGDRGLPDARANEGGATFLTMLMLLSLTSGIALWAFYAYKNPHTPSGQLLIKYRPSNWRWQDAETRYTAASIHM